MRVLFMSGYAGETLTESGALEHGAAFLEKPFSANDLAQRVRQTLDAYNSPRRQLSQLAERPKTAARTLLKRVLSEFT